MKTNLHPQWHDNAVVTCACGNTFTTGSTQTAIQVDICSHCHPLFTGEAKLIDTVGRIERFEKLRQQAQTSSSKKAKPKLPVQEDRPLTLKEMVQREQQRVASQ